LTWEELACKDGTIYPPEWQMRALTLGFEFEAIRRLAGNHQIQITSAYRTPAYNRAVGGAQLSQHIEGRALDLRIPLALSSSEFFAVCLERAREADSRIRGIGRYQTHVHIDTRQSLRLVHWNMTLR